MAWDDEIQLALPLPGPDEPADLRDDIRDELLDHLTCSMRRELLRGGDEHRAEARVRDRFGDPGKLARRLWWDSIKGQIMKRYLKWAAMTVAVVFISVWMVGSVWIIRQQALYLGTEIDSLQKNLQSQIVTIQRLQSQVNAAQPEASNAMMAGAGGMGSSDLDFGLGGGFGSGLGGMMGGGFGGGSQQSTVAQTQESVKLEELLKTLFPESDIKVIYLKNSILLRGAVDSPEIFDEAEEIARQFFENTLNHLTVTGRPTAAEAAGGEATSDSATDVE